MLRHGAEVAAAHRRRRHRRADDVPVVVDRALVQKLIFSPKHVEDLIAADHARTARNQQLQ